MRRFERKPFNRTVNCSVSIVDEDEQKTFNLKARAIDISIFGIGIETDCSLSPGYTLWFKGGIERGGVVKWCARIGNNYRAGVKLSEEGFYAERLVREFRENPSRVSTEVEKHNTHIKTAAD